MHEEYETNIKLAKEGYFVYDFALPLLLLHGFTFHTAENIANWIRICPRKQITVLDTHDGMGIDDISGLASVRALNLLRCSCAFAAPSGSDQGRMSDFALLQF